MNVKHPKSLTQLTPHPPLDTVLNHFHFQSLQPISLRSILMLSCLSIRLSNYNSQITRKSTEVSFSPAHLQWSFWYVNKCNQWTQECQLDYLVKFQLPSEPLSCYSFRQEFSDPFAHNNSILLKFKQGYESHVFIVRSSALLHCKLKIQPSLLIWYGLHCYCSQIQYSLIITLSFTPQHKGRQM